MLTTTILGIMVFESDDNDKGFEHVVVMQGHPNLIDDETDNGVEVDID